jgi:hypothetical protein
LGRQTWHSDTDSDTLGVIWAFLAVNYLFFGTLIVEKFRKFGKKVIAFDGFDDYDNKFSCDA